MIVPGNIGYPVSRLSFFFSFFFFEEICARREIENKKKTLIRGVSKDRVLHVSTL